MSTGHKLKIGVSGVRGIVGETFSPLLVSAFASAFGEFAGRGVILVGRDTRSSGELFEHAVSAGLSAVGAQVVQTGIVPTPSLLTAVRALNASGAIMITASHNPVEWNALKFIGADGFFLDHHTTEELLDIYNQPDPNYVTEQNLRPVRRLDNIFKMHQEHIFRHIDVDSIRNAGFKVAVDCGNGVGALYSRSFLEAMGVETITLHDSPDKPFERPPEPTPQNIGKLAETVCRHSCDIGFAQDPDGDRIAMVTNTGFIPGIQNSLLPAVEHILSRNPDNVIAANIQTTKALEAIAAKYNSKVVYTPVGEVNVTDAMQEYNAILGIEGGSGGFMVSSFMPCRDSFTAMAVTLELMAQKKVSSDEIYRDVIHYHSADKKIKCSAQAGINALRELAAKYAERNPVLIDGVRIDFGDSWVLVRQSNTEDILRIYAEAETPEKANSLAERFAKEIV